MVVGRETRELGETPTALPVAVQLGARRSVKKLMWYIIGTWTGIVLRGRVA